MANSPNSFLYSEIKKRFGNVKRSRGIYLYTEKGIRLTDCYLSGGRAILGYGGGKAQTAFKDVFERGANCFYDSGLLPKLEKAVKKLLPPNYCVRLYSDETIAAANMLSFFKDNGKVGDNQVFRDNRNTIDNSQSGDCRDFRESSVNKAADVALWRPWLDFCGRYTELKPGKQAQYSNVEVFFPNFAENQATPPIICIVPPFAYATSVKFYAFRNDLFSENELPANDCVPSPLLAAFTRGVYDLIGALAKYCEKDFKQNTAFLSSVFERKACYLFSKMDQSTYTEFVLKCLDSGIVLSPDVYEPSIVPWSANPGDLKKLSTLINV